jgi:hypothetical protein
MDISNKNEIVRFSHFPKYFSLAIIKSIMNTTLKDSKDKLRYLEYTGKSETPYKNGPIHIELCTGFSFTCHIYLNDYTDDDLYQFISLKLSYLIKSFKYLEMYCISSDGIFEHVYKSLNLKNELWKKWQEDNTLKNAHYISLIFEMPKAEGQTLCNLVIFRV